MISVGGGGKVMLKSFSKDIVSLKKPDGTIIENIQANVQPKTIFIPDSTLLIEEGDLLIRTLTNGGVEEYEVIDRGFYEKINGFNAHYQCKVRKLSSKKYTSTNNVVTNNFYGANARYNHNSTDNSTNVILESSNVFQSIRNAIEENVGNDEEKTVILQKVDEMDKAKGTPTFKDKYLEFMQALGNHVTIITPFLQPLNQILST